MKILFTLFLFSAQIVFSQQRLLVSPSGDFYPIDKGKSALQVAKEHGFVAADAMVCTDKATYGFSPDKFPTDGGQFALHKDVIGSWFIAPANGTIDSVFWTSGPVCAQDSILFLRIHQSNVYPGNGPGYNGYPLPSSSTCWGFYENTNDFDNGVAAFPEEATGPWQSTVVGTPNPSFPPTGAELWGAGGFPVVTHENSVNSVDLSVLGPGPQVTVNDKFFINFRINGFHGDGCTIEGGEFTGFLTYAEPNPLLTQNWKFYEHVVEFQPGFACKGWVARGGWHMSIWYSITVTSNIPPRFVYANQIHSTFSSIPEVVTTEIEDCNPASPLSAGVTSAVLSYTVNDISQSPISMDNIGGSTWEGTIPAQPVGSSVQYKIIATDSSGLADSTTTNTFRVLELGNEWYSVDTAIACVSQDIRNTGAEIPASAFFNPKYPGSGTAPKDDGTAGPFDMGYNFILFADTFRYAWVGVNGAIALTKSATDTNDVNANGFPNAFWDFPYPVHEGRNDTTGASNMPRMFIAPLWADHIIGDTTGTFGRILYGNNGDPCQFIVEWDSIGAFDANGSLGDETTFRVILNRCDGSIEFQYGSVGTHGLDSAALVGMQHDVSTPDRPDPYFYINRQTYPYETKPRNNWCIKMNPTIGASVNDGWNLVSVPCDPIGGNWSKIHLYPQATSSAFAFDNGYVTRDTLEKGRSYWMKFSGNQRAGGAASMSCSTFTFPVNNNWNLIGSVSGFVPTNTIVAGGGTAVTSPYYGYSGGYYVAMTIAPGQGYWVKVAGPGTLTMTASAAAPKALPTASELGIDDMNTITIRDSRGKVQVLYVGEESQLKQDISYFELPPAPPAGAFDARFTASGRMVETYPNAIDRAIEYPVSIQSASYPVSVSWKLNEMEHRKFEITGGNKTTEMGSTGTRVISDSKINTFVIRVAGGLIPKEFALSQNYPNPFNPVTRFRIDVAKTSEVDVAVYDILGRKILMLLNEERTAGSYTMEWNGKDNRGLTVPTGIYFIRMTAGEFTDSKKITFMK